MKFSIFLNPQIPGSGNGPEGAARRPIGRDTESYQRLLDEVREIAVLGDQAGYHALMLTEHHFHSEGFEFSVNPLMVLADLAARTERILLAPLGLVLPTWDPIRAAEDVALLDQFSKGRVRLGVARGYQTRWANTLGQRWNTGATASDGSGKDDRNFDVFGEILKIMKMAWTQETIRYQSDVLDGWSVPYPYDGVPDWPAQEWTRKFGAPGELDADGKVVSVSVCPRPYQYPHPELWQPFTISDRSIKRCAEEDILPWIFVPRPEDLQAKCELYQAECAKNGREYALGEHTGVLKVAMIGDSAEQLAAEGAARMLPDFIEFFGPFGYLEVMRTKDDDPKRPVGPKRASFQRMIDVELALVGTPDDIKRGIDRMLKRIPDLEWFGLFMQGQQGVAPIDDVKRQLELFAEHIIPEYAD